MKDSKTYSEKLRDPRWQRKRLEVMQRDNFTCRSCKSTTTTLNVHHISYTKGAEPWEYELEDLLTLCEDCHEYESDNFPEAKRKLLSALVQGGFDAMLLDMLASALSPGTVQLLGHIVWNTVSINRPDRMHFAMEDAATSIRNAALRSSEIRGLRCDNCSTTSGEYVERHDHGCDVCLQEMVNTDRPFLQDRDPSALLEPWKSKKAPVLCDECCFRLVDHSGDE